MNLTSELNSFMVKYRFRPSKKLAQFFVIDEKVVEDLVKKSALTEKDVVLEIGAGTGFLTRKLQEKCRTVAVELDDVLFELLEEELSKKNLELIHGNFLEVDLPNFSKIVSLPPYTISSGIIYRLINEKFNYALLVFQKEFAQKLVAEPGFKDYCALSVLTQAFFETSIVSTISPQAFFPRPKTFSVIVQLVKKNVKELNGKEKQFVQFVKNVFRFSNKNLHNALDKSFPFLEKEIKVEKAEFDEKVKSLKLFNQKVNLISSQEMIEIFSKFC